MGLSISTLSKRDISNKSIFNNRFVVEVCEKVHLHYRNLRLNLDLHDFLELCKGCTAALDRWGRLGGPVPKKGQHIELCRKRVATEAHNDGIQVNLNKNLYKPNKGKIFAEGAEFTDERYIHLKIRDMRLEFSEDEFKELADVIQEAKDRLENSYTESMCLD